MKKDFYLTGENLTDEFLQEVKRIINEEFEFDYQDSSIFSFCGKTLAELMTDDEISYLALKACKANWPSLKEIIGAIMVKGYGQCENCGSNETEDIEGDFIRPYCDFGGFEILGYRCRNCGYEERY